MPTRMVLAATDIARSWDATSDSLAAWLVGKIGARHLLLVKHGEFLSGRARCEDLAALGVVDKSFARHARLCAVAAFIPARPTITRQWSLSAAVRLPAFWSISAALMR